MTTLKENMTMKINSTRGLAGRFSIGKYGQWIKVHIK